MPGLYKSSSYNSLRGFLLFNYITSLASTSMSEVYLIHTNVSHFGEKGTKDTAQSLVRCALSVCSTPL